MKNFLFAILILNIFGHALSQNLPFIKAEGTHFINPANQEEIRLKGVNLSNSVWGFWEWPVSDSLSAAGSDPLIRPAKMKDFIFSLEDVDHIRQLGGNVVRYQINYELFAANNPLRDQNIQAIRRHIACLDSINVYTVVCLSMPPGLDGSNEFYENDKSSSIRLKSVFESDSLFVLWRNMWQYVAGKLEDLNAVAGYELLNEPRKPALADAGTQDLVEAYREVVDSIRSADSRHVIFICEFNSREANPGESYWSNALSAFVTDQGEQGIIWDQEWIGVDRPNISYVIHIYNPFEFTLGKTSLTFSSSAVLDKIAESVSWSYDQHNAPLFVSEYGVNYYHVLQNNDLKRMEWLTLIHNAFDQYDISTAYFQYKDLITPWSDVGNILGIWMHYYDMTTVSGVSNGQVTYSDSPTEAVAVSSGIDDLLNTWFVQGSILNAFSYAGNSSLINELKRYFTGNVLNLIFPADMNRTGKIYIASGDRLVIEDDSSGEYLNAEIYDLSGRNLFSILLKKSEDHFETHISSLKIIPGIYLVRYSDKIKQNSGLLYVP